MKERKKEEARRGGETTDRCFSEILDSGRAKVWMGGKR